MSTSLTKKVVLRFVLKGGNDLCTILDESQARVIISKWKRGEFRGDDLLTDDSGWWVVRQDQIAGIHYADVPSQPAQQSLPPPRPAYPQDPWGRSGN